MQAFKTAAALTIAAATFLSLPARAGVSLETAGTGVAIALPVIAGGISFYKHDRKGLGQLFLETGFTVGTAFVLKQVVRERRPDGSDYQSFPSETTALSASGSSYLWGRYGWSYGLPAFAATQFVSFTRVDAKKHHWYDTMASSAIAAGYGYFITTPFEKRYHVRTGLNATPDGAFLQLRYDF